MLEATHVGEATALVGDVDPAVFLERVVDNAAVGAVDVCDHKHTLRHIPAARVWVVVAGELTRQLNEATKDLSVGHVLELADGAIGLTCKSTVSGYRFMRCVRLKLIKLRRRCVIVEYCSVSVRLRPWQEVCQRH